VRRFCLLIATLFLIGCSTNASLEPTMVVGETSSALEPSPVAVADPPTEEPVAPPTEEATVAVAPSEPPEQPSPEPTEQAGPSYLPPADQAWLRSDSRLISFGAQTVEIDLQALGLPEAVQRFYVAPNGQYAAYIDINDQLNLLSAQGASTIDVDGQATSLAFSPKSDYLAISTIDEGEQRWQLQAYDLTQGSLSELASSNEANRMAVHLLDWTDAGILLDRLLWATDAPPIDLALFVPESKEFLPIFAEGHFSTAISRDGQQVAVSTGYVPIGETPSFDLSLINRSSGASTALREMGEGYLRSLSFSPDGSQLFYAFSKGYGGEALTLVLYSIVSGQSQRIELSYANPQDGLKDALWHDNNTLLIAVADAGKTQVLQLGIDQFSSDGLRLVYEEPRSDQQNWTELVYTP
jgi:hypothetical protein